VWVGNPILETVVEDGSLALYSKCSSRQKDVDDSAPGGARKWLA
jgi:hypothetical protein